MTTTIFGWMEQGGVVMWILLLASVVAMARFLERLWTLRATRSDLPGLLASLRSALG